MDLGGCLPWVLEGGKHAGRGGAVGGGRLLRVVDANGVDWSCAQKRYSGVADARRILQRSNSECGGRIDKGRTAC